MSPEIDSHIQILLIYHKGAIAVQWEKVGFALNCAVTLNIHMKT